MVREYTRSRLMNWWNVRNAVERICVLRQTNETKSNSRRSHQRVGSRENQRLQLWQLSSTATENSENKMKQHEHWKKTAFE